MAIVCLLLTLLYYQVMKLLEEIKDRNNQFDLGKLCSIMTKDEKEEAQLTGLTGFSKIPFYSYFKRK